ncbi:DUF4126 domain-containing protein [Nocardioides gilvus]|uniref:DUF4126 domain-containing protein n=1 Tax=Nocardioides gilvus TaxID=1735589 RepID=UPI000D74D373|nr:DUF4126 domain-containing protein [Nocardioides gilvus]
MLAALTGVGLSAAAGLNAYIPFLVVAVIARFTDVIELPSAYAWIESWWAIGVGAVLLLTEVVLDKIPLVDSFNDAVQTAIRPASAGVVFAATSAAQDVEDSWTWLDDNTWVGVVLGVVVALVVHGLKAGVRPLINAGTLGAGAPLVSTAEDTASVSLALVAIFLPVLVVVALVALAVLTYVVLSAVVRRGRARRSRARGAEEGRRTG